MSTQQKGIEQVSAGVLDRRYQLQLQIVQDRFRFSHEGEVNFLRGVFLANGGAIIALLTFIGSDADIVEPHAAFWSFVWLGAGMVTAMLASLGSMLANSYYFLSNFRRLQQVWGDLDDAALAWVALDEAAEAKRGNVAYYVLIGAGLLSVLSFVVGIFVALDAIT